jgi:short-subunit dehydrogenase
MSISFLRPMSPPITDWSNKRIWIIGASSGIGASLAKSFLLLDAIVILSARREDELNKIAAPFPRALVLAFDVQDQGAWLSSDIDIKKRLEGVDLIIFCAAKYTPERTWEIRTDDISETLNINLRSVYQGLSTILPAMLARGNGGVAIVASVAGYIGLPNASVYGPTKAALINLAEILYSDLHAKNIGVYLINPGFVRTDLTAKNTFIMPALQTPEQAAQAIINGIQKGKFEIHFPRRFTMILKLLQMLPYRLRFALISRFVIQ